MNETDRAAIRESVLNGPDDLTVQLQWNQECLAEHRKIEQRMKARFKLADFSGDEGNILAIEKDMKEIRAAITFIEGEIARLSA